MSGLGFFIHWIDILAGLVERLRETWRGRRALVVTRDGERFLIRSGGGADAPLVAATTAGSLLPEDVLRRARGEFILLDWPRDRIVTRKITLPAQAHEFMSGIIRNQIERLSPWPVTQIFYGLVARPSSQAGSLDVQVLIASRGEIESARARLADSGLMADRVIVAPDESANAAPVILWSRNTQQAHPDRRRLRLVIGGGLAGYAAVCAALSLWALTSAASLQAESEEFATRARNLQKRAQAAKSPQAIAALSPPERAWVRKETSISTVFLLESLSQSLPDGAYLTELQLEADKLRVIGLADDAPPLIGALETSGQLSEVRFSAPTTRGPDGRLFRFSIEAQVAARLALKGE